MKRNQVSAPELWALHQKHGDRCQNIKPWSFELDNEKYVVPVAERTGDPLIKSAYQETNNRAHRDFSERVASVPRYISVQHRAMLDEYATENNCTLRNAIEKAIELLPTSKQGMSL